MKKKVGFLGGGFDPIHFGHLNLALSLKEAAHLDKVFLIPARCSPFKENQPPVASDAHRLAMLKIAIEGMEGFEVQGCELTRSAPSYTIDTVRELALDASLELHLLLAEDHIPTFFSWKGAEDLVRLAPPLIGTRHKDRMPSVCSWATLVPTPCFEISSTQIRQRLKARKYCGHLVPQRVLAYIQQHQLYVFDDK